MHAALLLCDCTLLDPSTALNRRHPCLETPLHLIVLDRRFNFSRLLPPRRRLTKVTKDPFTASDGLCWISYWLLRNTSSPSSRGVLGQNMIVDLVIRVDALNSEIGRAARHEASRVLKGRCVVYNVVEPEA